MSKSELKDEKKKRKRQEDEAADVPKKSKKSKKTKDGEVDGVLAVEEKKEKKEKKSKKAKKNDSNATADDATPAATSTEAADTSMAQDFIAFDDEPMPDAFAGDMNGTLSRTDGKKAKKDKKDKKAKKSKDVVADESASAVAEEPTEKSKSKKDKKSKKSKSAAAEEEEPAQAVEPELVADAVDSDASTSKEKKSKKEKKDKKSKKSKGDEAAEPMDLAGAAKQDSALSAFAENADTKSKKGKKSQKDKKSKKTSTEEEESEAVVEPSSAANGTEDQMEQANGEADAEHEADKHDRFIVFVGNLPFSATKEQVEEHFAKLKPFVVRLRTYKDTDKSMGCGFIEFERYDHMQTALMKYHHSVFPDPKKKEGRKINVELSAGGGGNTAARVEKIKAKNEKLANERQRNHDKRAEIETKQKERKEKKEAKQGKEGGDGEEEETAAAEPDNGGIHPARLAMMNAPARPEKKFKPNLGNRPKFGGGPPPKGRRY